MVTISLCMIVKNEEQVIARCLESIQTAVDEIIIVDTGSVDQTKEIAQKYTDKIYDFQWIDDFSAARNFAYEKAKMDYQMWLDADDVMPQGEREKLIQLKKTLDSSVDMVAMQYHTHFDEQDKPILTSTRERLTKREKQYRWIDPVHECIPLSGNVLYSDIAVYHRKPAREEAVSWRNLRIYEKLEQSGKALTPRQLYYFARELKDHAQYAKAIYYFNRFLQGKAGWAEDNIAACIGAAACYKVLGEQEAGLDILLKSFTYDSPRAETCCEIGYYYKAKSNFKTALEWFELATKLGEKASLGFVSHAYADYIPCLEACVCCCYLGDFDKAKDYNEKAAAIKPNSEAVLHNRAYLREKIAK